MQNSFDRLDVNNHAVKRKSKLLKLVLMASYLGIWVFSLIVFWGFIQGSDAMGYSLIFLFILIPLTTLIISLLIGVYNCWGRGKWFFAPAFGVMYMLAEYATFSTANMIAFHKINAPNLEMIMIGTAISLVGMGIGAGADHLISKADKSN